MKVSCVVLAAGKSSRYGENKLLVPLAGIPVLLRTLQSLPETLRNETTVVVSAAETEALCAGFRSLRYPGGCLSDSIRLGMTAAGDAAGCLFVQGDQPLLQTRSLQNMLNAFQDAPDCVYRLGFDGAAGSPVLFPRRLFPALNALRGERGGLAAARDEPFVIVPAASAWELWDVDTPERLCAAENQLRGK